MSNHHQILTELVEKIELTADLTIGHPDYPPFQLPPEEIARFQQMPPQLQQKYAIVSIQNYLHDLYFSHSLPSLQKLAMLETQSAPTKNNTVNGIDVNFYQQLQQRNPSRGYFDRDWQIVAETEAGELVVVKDGLHLHIDPHYHFPPDLTGANIGDLVPIFLPPDLVGQDTYIMIGNSGIPDRLSSVQLYFNFTPTAALEIAPKLTQNLNQLELPFQLAILHNPLLFDRYDAATLTLPQAAYAAAQPILHQLYQDYQAEFSPAVPIFTKQLAPGLAIAETPIATGSFGLQRCGLLAAGLLTAMAQNQTSPVERLKMISQELTTADIEPLQPYLNPGQRDSYGWECIS
jgi:hypothetical protein